MPEDDVPVQCYYCGRYCSHGFEYRDYGTDLETGYKDEIIICHDCSGKGE